MRASTLLALVPLAMAAPQVKRTELAPVVVPRGANLIENHYIVRMKSGVVAATVSAATSKIQSKADYTYKNTFQGFAATLTEAELEELRNDPNVDYIEQDATITKYDTQDDAPWGLARISNEEPGSSTYTYPSSAGEGVCAYVLDTGIDVDHEDFEGRAEFAANFADNNDGDVDGHGTHVAGTIGGATYGVAKKATLLAVKVLNDFGEGTNAGVIGGMDYVVEDGAERDCPNGVVVNMSLGGGFSSSINDAAAAISDAGHFLAVASGNANSDASGFSPASEPSACTVGATDEDDAHASFSNYGSLVDVLAPGVDIESAATGGGSESLSGTSMASPHVAGLAAVLLGEGASASGLCDTIASSALEDVISGVPSDTVNLLIHNSE